MALAQIRQRGHSRAMPSLRIGMFTSDDTYRNEVAAVEDRGWRASGHGDGDGDGHGSDADVELFTDH